MEFIKPTLSRVQPASSPWLKAETRTSAPAPDRRAGEDLARRAEPEDHRSHEPANHGSAPVEGQMLARQRGVEAQGRGLHQVVDEQAADGHLGADVDEDRPDPQGQPRPAHEAEAVAEARGRFGVAQPFAGTSQKTAATSASATAIPA